MARKIYRGYLWEYNRPKIQSSRKKFRLSRVKYRQVKEKEKLEALEKSLELEIPDTGLEKDI